MTRQSVYQGQMGQGIERYGAVAGVEIASVLPNYVQTGTEPAPPSGNKYEGKQGVCIHVGADGMQCRGPRAKETDFCIGHLRAIEKLIKASQKAEQEDESRTD